MSGTYKLGNNEYTSRLIVGTGKYASFEQTRDAIEASGTQIVTVALRRTKLDGRPEENLLNYIDPKKYTILPNTAGCYTTKDAILTCQLAREALGISMVKLEVIGDEKTLFPDNEATIEAAKELVKDGFTVLPYCIDDPIVCRKLEEIGCSAVMPLAAPIGSGLGICNPYNLKIIMQSAKIPVLVDAGVGTASDVAFAMELGCTAVIVNTAIAKAGDPIRMAKAMRDATVAGRLAFEAGRIPQKLYATASSPIEGVLRT